ncbi:rhomboid family intramembrane serine protease [Phenylobacterium montanum]|uniref:Rhomboid family intramembrane serine protease n=1 Tax=Phenylobacterium montanum TaxID=2823693 RepID=A0A975ITF1_9CAUL|nr:rhomboid family intramembrane serine protease [Caulobacter sp. S6]QUD86399.1 rhomboid family intramembrane serine protease [Caulobacter sp. S6]
MSEEATFGRRVGGDGAGGSALRGALPQTLLAGAMVIEPELKVKFAVRSARRPAPYLTLAIIGALALIYAAERHFNISPTPDTTPGPNSLIALGAASRQLVFGAHEPWRLITAALLHANLAHIVGNCIVLLMAGATLERLIGRAWLAAAFVICGLGGTVASILCNPSQTTTVGASGAIMGLLAVALVISFHVHAADRRRRIQFACARIAIPALIPFSSVQGAPIDYNGHGGGFLAGLLLGFLIRAAWPEERVHPAGEKLASRVGLAGAAIAAVAFLLVALRYPTYAQAGEPYASELPQATPQALQDPDFDRRTARLVQLYPHDPRARLIRSDYLLARNDLYPAEAEARAAIDEHDAWAGAMPRILEPMLHFELAQILIQERRWKSAEAEADPWCDVQFRARLVEQQRETLLGEGLCGGWRNNKAQMEGS